jgi:tRNA splicing endonuclease
VHEVEERGRMPHPHSLDKNQKGHYFPTKKKEERKKIYTKIHSQSTKEQANIRSTLNSFYQVEENKKRMLKKIQQEKERANDLRLSEAFFITKYGSRFRIDSKTLKG